VVSLYALTLCMAALSFSFLGHFVFIKSDLISPPVPLWERRREWKRGTWGFLLYGAASVLAFLSVHVAHVVLVGIPFLFIVPRILGRVPSPAVKCGQPVPNPELPNADAHE